MKKHNIFNIIAGAALTLGATACSSDYLDLEPVSTPTYEEAVTSAGGARLAVYGICNSMYKQYSGLYSYNWFNGEPWTVMYYGDVMGQDYISLFWVTSDVQAVRWVSMNQQSTGARVAWTYCYGLISQANNIITFAPKLKDDEGKVIVNEDGNEVPDITGEYAFRYAQALTMRAHGYIRLMQIYAPRWEDRFAANGDEYLTVPLRLEWQNPEGNLDCPLSPMSVVMDQIYADLNQALELYEESKMHRDYMWEPDINVAMGLYSRAALIRNDYVTAQKMAHDARQGYPIMSGDDYLAGFVKPTSEWLWTNSGEAQNIYYGTFGAVYACNGAYPCIWETIGAGAIDNDLLNQADLLDQRALPYFAPLNVSGAMNRNRFWSDACNEATLNINNKTSALHSTFVQFAQKMYDNVKGQENGWFPPYTTQGAPLSEVYTIAVAQFGAQFKFWGEGAYSASYFPFMRASELALTEAEAAYQNGDMAAARQALDDVNSQRIIAYTGTTASGQALLDEIKLSRRLELWGEGFSWFDFKRWRQTITRRNWVSRDTNSGNWPSNAAGEFKPDTIRGWRWRIPSTEYNYNHAIDQAEANAD